METPEGGFILDCSMRRPYVARWSWSGGLRFALRPDEALVLGEDFFDDET
jgi:hypothetical protein